MDNKFRDIEKRLQAETIKVVFLRGMDALVRSEHWDFLQTWAESEIDGATEREEAEPDMNMVNRYIGLRQGVRKILAFPKDIEKLPLHNTRLEEMKKSFHIEKEKFGRK